MRITRLEVSGFRNYERFAVDVDPSLTVLVGRNAAGKTNLVEAVRLLTSTLPLRRGRLSDLVRWGSEDAVLALVAAEGKRRLEIGVRITAEGRRSYTVNGQAKRSAAEVAGLLPSVTFTPDDLTMVKGPAELRRNAVDDVGEQLSATYGALRRDYARVVRHRNHLLRDQAPQADLSVWDQQAAVLGGRLVTHRIRLAYKLMASAAQGYALLSDGEELTFRYADKCGLPTDRDPSSLSAEEAAEAIAAQIEVRAPEERRRAAALVGPQRDEIVFMVSGREARTYASQGQQRTITLALKLAEVAVVEEVLRRKPVLLLDDVMSELDERRREALSRLVASEVQTIVTTTNLGYFGREMLDRATIVQLGAAESNRA